MLLDLIALSILVFFAFFGSRRGALATGLGLGGLVGAYVAGAVAASRFGATVGAQLAQPELVGMAVAGCGAFVAAFLGIGIVGGALRSAERRRRGDLPRGGVDRLFGAVFGAARGGLVVLLIAWLAIWIDAARSLGVTDGLSAVPDPSRSAAAQMTRRVVAGAVGAAFSDAGPAAQVAAQLAASPASTIESIQTLLDDRRILAVQEDRLFWTYVRGGATEAALNRGSFYRIAHDDDLRGQLASLGLVSVAAATDPNAFRDEARVALDTIGPRLRGLAEDPEMQALARDPEVIAMLESGDTFGLLQHAGIQRVVSRVSAGTDPTY